MANTEYVPDSTAVRVALWRAMHVQVDAKPHVLDDEIGLQLVAPPDGWRERPDMHPQFTAPFRASIVARARYIEDLVAEETEKGLPQYVMLGAGLDTFVQRRPDVAAKLKVFEIDKPDTQAWKKRRLAAIGHPMPSNLKFVSVNFETGESWWKNLVASGFDPKRPTLVTSIGVSMYLTMEAIEETLRQMTELAPGSKFIMTFMLPLDLVEPKDRTGYEMAIKGAQRDGTPFISFFSPKEMIDFARKVGFRNVETTSTSNMDSLYFANRTDGLKPSTGEDLLIATI